MNRFVAPAVTLLALAPALSAQQQTVRWNDIAAALDDLKEPPTVHVWLDRRVLEYGEPVRVSFRVDEDAFVVVGRVDWDGNLTVLFPRSRGRGTAVRGGEDVIVRSARMGTRATFVANERSGGTGYVFALASRAPLDLSRLSQRDFSSWVTGIPLGRPTSRYVGDPYRVIQRFARLVLYNPEEEWDYDVEFYSVDMPSWVTASYYTGGYGCAPWNAWVRRNLWTSYGYGSLDEFGDASLYGYDYGRYGCGYGSGLLGCYVPVYGYGLSLPFLCGYRRTGGAVATAPTSPPPPPLASDSARVNPWVPDSIKRPNVDRGTAPPNGPHVMTVDPQRPAPVGWNARDDLSFSIPSRALRGLRERNRSEIDRSPVNGGESSGPIPMPSRPTPEVGNPTQPIEWVRPPRSFDQPPRDIERMPVRGGIQRDPSSFRGPDRSAIREWSPPPRSSTPMFEREPVRGSSMPSGRTYDGGVRNPYTPPTHIDSRPMTSPAIHQASPPPAASAPPARADAPAVRSPASSGEKKPPGEAH